MLGGGEPPRLGAMLGDFLARTQLPFFTTQMGKGTTAGEPTGQPIHLWMGTAALSERDHVHEAIDKADLILAIGHDTVEKPPFLMGPLGPTVIHVGYTLANVEEVYFPHASVVGDVGPSLALLADRLEGRLPNASALLPLQESISAADQRRGRDDRFPSRRNASSPTCVRSCPTTASSPWTTACTRSGSRGATARPCPTPCCWTTRWRPWERAALGDDGALSCTPVDGFSPSAATAAS